jgi:hypothetical protein
MELATLLVAVFGVFLGALSLGWQMASRGHVSSRVDVELRIGAMPPGESVLISGPLRSMTAASMVRLASLGYTRPVIAVRVRNVGRAPATIMQWSMVDNSGNAMTPNANSIGQPLPYQLQVGESQTWAVDADVVRAMGEATAVALFDLSSSLQMRGRIELAGGRVIDTDARLQLHNRRLRAVGW